MGALSVTDHPITGEIARSSGSCSTARKPATKSTPLVKPFGKLSFTGTLARPEGKLFGATPFSEPGSPRENSVLTPFSTGTAQSSRSNALPVAQGPRHRDPGNATDAHHGIGEVGGIAIHEDDFTSGANRRGGGRKFADQRFVEYGIGGLTNLERPVGNGVFEAGQT